jgi:hypothetical protein
MKIHPMGSELFHVNRQTDVTKLVVTFHTFADVPKNFKNLLAFPLRAQDFVHFIVQFLSDFFGGWGWGEGETQTGWRHSKLAPLLGYVGDLHIQKSSCGGSEIDIQTSSLYEPHCITSFPHQAHVFGAVIPEAQDDGQCPKCPSI